MKKKIIIAYFLTTCICYSLFASQYPLTGEKGIEVFASDNNKGPIDNTNTSSIIKILINSLGEEFSPQWIETFVEKDIRYAFSMSYSKDLAKILPVLSSSYYIIRPKITKTSTNVTIRFIDGKYLTFIYENIDNKLIAINSSKI